MLARALYEFKKMSPVCMSSEHIVKEQNYLGLMSYEYDIASKNHVDVDWRRARARRRPRAPTAPPVHRARARVPVRGGGRARGRAGRAHGSRSRASRRARRAREGEKKVRRLERRLAPRAGLRRAPRTLAAWSRKRALGGRRVGRGVGRGRETREDPSKRRRRAGRAGARFLLGRRAERRIA